MFDVMSGSEKVDMGVFDDSNDKNCYENCYENYYEKERNGRKISLQIKRCNIL